MSATENGTTLDHLLQLTPEQAVAVVKNLSQEQKAQLGRALVGAVQQLANHVVQNADALWEEGQQRRKELH